MNTVQEFNDYRARMNERILAQDNLVLKRFWSLDNQTYQEGALDVKTKAKVPQDLQRLTTAEATEGMIQDRNHFNGFASLWLNEAKILDTAQSIHGQRAAYQSLQQSCLSCHSQYCQGPIPMIEGLNLK